MGWANSDGTPLGDLLAVASAYRVASPVASKLLMTEHEYEHALDLAGGDPDRVDAEARRLGFSGVERYRC